MIHGAIQAKNKEIKIKCCQNLNDVSRTMVFPQIKKLYQQNTVTASSGTTISTDFATLTCSEILSKILIRCVTWH